MRVLKGESPIVRVAPDSPGVVHTVVLFPFIDIRSFHKKLTCVSQLQTLLLEHPLIIGIVHTAMLLFVNFS